MTERLKALLSGVYQTLAAADARGSDEFMSQHVKLAKANVEEALGVLKVPVPDPEPAAAPVLLGADAPLPAKASPAPAKAKRVRTTKKKK